MGESIFTAMACSEHCSESHMMISCILLSECALDILIFKHVTEKFTGDGHVALIPSIQLLQCIAGCLTLAVH